MLLSPVSESQPGKVPRLCLFVAALLIWASTSLQAQTWLGPIPGNGLWTDSANWVGGKAPTSDGTANVIFSQSNSSNAVLLSTSRSVNTLFFNSTPGLGTSNYGSPAIRYASPYDSSDYSLSKPSLSVRNGIINASNSLITINPTLGVSQDQTWDVGFQGLAVYNVTGGGRITKISSGSLGFYGTQSTWYGGLSATAGTVILGPSSSFGASYNTLAFDGVTLKVLAPSNAAVNVGQQMSVGSGGLRITGRSYLATLFSGMISGPGALTFARDPDPPAYAQGLWLRHANSYTGGTKVEAAVSLEADSGSLGTGDVVVQSGGALILSKADALATGRTVTLQAATDSTFPSVLVMGDPAIDPTLLINPASTGGAVALGDNITYLKALDLATIGNGLYSLGAGGIVQSQAHATYAASTLGPCIDGVYRLGIGTGFGELTIDGTDNVLTGPNSLLIGQGGVTITNFSLTSGSAASRVILKRANNFTGGTLLAGGILVPGNDAALGSGPLTIQAGGIEAWGGVHTIPNAIFLTATGAFNLNSDENSLTFTGSVDLSGSTRQLKSQSSQLITFAGVISNGGLLLNGGNYALTAANTFAGGLTSYANTLSVASDANLGAPAVTLTFGGGILQPTGPTLTINRPIVVNASLGAISSNGGTVTVNGAITGSVTLTKRGAGTLVLTNPGSYAPMSVIEGTLQVDNAPPGKSPVGMQTTVQSGGVLAGTGFVAYTTIGDGGHLAPGDGGPGKLTVGSGLSLYNGASLDFDLGTQAADQLVVSGHLFEVQAGKPVVVNLADVGGLAPGQTYDLVSWGTADASGVTAASFQLGSSPVNGTFSITPSGTVRVTTAAYTPYQQWQARYFGSINNASAAPTANPSGDGISNLLKYALGLDPLHAANAGLPQVGRAAGYLTLTYSRPKAVTDVVYTPQFSDDLATWSNANVTQSVLADDGTTQTIQAKAPTGGINRRFLRLSVSSSQ